MLSGITLKCTASVDCAATLCRLLHAVPSGIVALRTGGQSISKPHLIWALIHLRSPSILRSMTKFVPEDSYLACEEAIRNLLRSITPAIHAGGLAMRAQVLPAAGEPYVGTPSDVATIEALIFAGA